MQVEGTRSYRVKDVAEHFDVSVSTIYRAIELGQLEALKHGAGPGTVRIPGTAVLAYAQACRQAAHEATVTAAGVSAVAGAGGLSPAQADGLACVVCGVDFVAVGVSRAPVGQSGTGSQVFACGQHRAGSVRLTSAGSYVDVMARVPEAAATAHIEAGQRSLADARSRHAGQAAAGVELVGEVAR